MAADRWLRKYFVALPLVRGTELNGAMVVYRLIIRSSTGWSPSDQDRVSNRAGALAEPAPRLTDHGFELSVKAPTADAALDSVEAAVHGIHSHTGVYLATELVF